MSFGININFAVGHEPWSVEDFVPVIIKLDWCHEILSSTFADFNPHPALIEVYRSRTSRDLLYFIDASSAIDNHSLDLAFPVLAEYTLCPLENSIALDSRDSGVVRASAEMDYSIGKNPNESIRFDSRYLCPLWVIS